MSTPWGLARALPLLLALASLISFASCEGEVAVSVRAPPRGAAPALRLPEGRCEGRPQPCVQSLWIVLLQEARCEDVSKLGPGEDRCAFARERCEGQGLGPSYLELYYCHFQPHGALVAASAVVGCRHCMLH
jgi:hypothetical protein